MQRLLTTLTAIYFALLFIRPQEFVPSLQGSSLVQWLLLVVVMVWLATPSLGRSVPQNKLAFMLVLVAIASHAVNAWLGGMAYAAITLLPATLMIPVLAQCVQDPARLRALGTVVVACACILTLHGHLQATSGQSWAPVSMVDGRIYYLGILSDPNDLALFFTMAIGLLTGPLWPANTFLRRIALVAAIGWLGYGIFLSQSRGGMLAALAVGAYTVWRRWGVSALVAMGALVLPLLFAATRLAQVNAEEESAAGRVDAWYEGIQEFLYRPIFGAGFALFPEISGSGLTAHNSLILVLTELGFFGYCAWIGICLCTIVMVRRLVRSQPAVKGAKSTETPRQGESLDHALFAATLGFAVAAFFLSQSYKIFLFLLVGCVAGRYIAVEKTYGALGPPFTTGWVVSRSLTWAVTTFLAMWILVKILI